MFAEKSLEDAAKYNTLGPAYFEARAIVERHMEKFEPEHFQPLIDTFTTQFRDALWDSVRDHLLSDTELNLQGSLYRMVDDCVAALLSGEEWALKRYALGRYRQEEIRKAIAKHIPTELQDARMADLEAEVKRLKENLRFYQNRSSNI